MEAGSVAEWLSALSTILATGAAGIAGYVAYRAYLREKSRDRQALASGIHAWMAQHTDSADRKPRIVLVNSTPSLIYQLRVELTQNGKVSTAPSKDGAWQVLPPGTFVVGPHNRYPWALPEPAIDLQQYRPYTLNEGYLVTAIEFSDARGVRWRRDGEGRLIELADMNQAVAP